MNRLLLLALIAALAIPAGAGAKLIVGISDQNASTFSDPLYSAAKLTVARYVVPFDVTSDPLAEGEVRRLAVGGAGGQPEGAGLVRALTAQPQARRQAAIGGGLPQGDHGVQEELRRARR